MGSFRTIINNIKSDFEQSNIRSDFSKSLDRLKKHYLSREEQEELKFSNAIKRWFLTMIWIFAALYNHLEPFRRVLLIIGIFLLVISKISIGGNVSFGGLHVIGGILLIVVILLEVMDKMLAKSELREGRSIQLSLQPEESPDIEGWDILLYSEPANTVGGDLLDFQSISEYEYGITVGDVAGKGVRAALMMGKLQTIIHAVSIEEEAPDSAAVKINRLFRRESIPAIFASAFFLRVKPNDNQISCVNAGHLPPVIIRKESIEELSKGGAALGLLDAAEYSAHDIHMDSGDILVVFSDGLTEAENEYGNFFGQQRLLSLLEKCRPLTASEAGKKILSDVFQFCGEAEQHDDITFAVIKKL